MKSFFKIYAVAFQLLTIFPVGLPVPANDAERARSTAFFPVVGLFLGVVLSLLHGILLWVLPNDITDFLAIILLTVFSRGLYLRGFAATVEGFSRGAAKKNPPTSSDETYLGVNAAFGLVFIQLIKYYALAGIPLAGKGLALVLWPMTSCWVMVLLCYLSKFTAATTEPPRDFIRLVTLKEFAIATAITLIVSVLYLKLKAPGIIFIMVMFSLIFTKVFQCASQTFNRDALGASNEMSGALFLIGIQLSGS